jgi:hypothetical protein
LPGGFAHTEVRDLAFDSPSPGEEINVAIRDFLQERWKGLISILWGSQLRQERFNDLIYRSLLNMDKLPGPKASRLASELYDQPNRTNSQPNFDEFQRLSQNKRNIDIEEPPIEFREISQEVLVIGGGLAGLNAALKLCSAGRRVN